MKKRYKLKKRKRVLKNIIFIFIVFIFSFYIAFKIFDINGFNQNFVLGLFSDTNSNVDTDNNLFKRFVSYINNINIENDKLVTSNYVFKDGSNNASDSLASNATNNDIKVNPVTIDEIKSDPIVYIYNTHQTEEYNYIANDSYNIKPNVTVNNYILKEQLANSGINSIVEENNVMSVLNSNGWNYASSYKVSRMFMEDAKQKFPSLKYFVDLHRDSVSKKISTTTINNKSYARILFIIGLENSNYQANLDFTNRLNERFNSLYPNLSRGIYKKQGSGVNGIYNQDFSDRTILIEVGGEENTIEEVNNTMLAISNVLIQIIGEDYE